MHFSVLLSLYKKEQPSYLLQCLNSIFYQTILPNEIVLVLDGPLNDELDYIVEDIQKKIPYLKTIPISTNQGLGKALNEGLKHCSYDLVARMDTDDIAKPDRFEKQLAIFRKHPEVDVVGAWIDEFEGDTSNVLSVRKVPEWHGKIIQFAKRRCPVNHPVVMFRKSAVLKVGGYKHFPLFEDYYLWMRMLINGARFYNIQESLLFFRFTPDMFRRRGGLKYAVTEMRLQYLFYQIGFINIFTMMKNISIRLVVRLLPNSLRSSLYKRTIRNNGLL
ncbi:glycosyltransferase family 2 protein [Parabacteroides goldsteinii]|uniref:glycosyltransferase family 2 protein n=1 Tax=Parabacteroides goldsteinii TaxID=328812 RepID=UPI00189920B5|nr:glycosyltransferase [Parabacteroides goldsteinii]